MLNHQESSIFRVLFNWFQLLLISSPNFSHHFTPTLFLSPFPSKFAIVLFPHNYISDHARVTRLKTFFSLLSTCILIFLGPRHLIWLEPLHPSKSPTQSLSTGCCMLSTQFSPPTASVSHPVYTWRLSPACSSQATSIIFTPQLQSQFYCSFFTRGREKHWGSTQ